MGWMQRAVAAGAVATTLTVAGACSDDGGGDGIQAGIEVPDDATFCSVFDSEFADALDAAYAAGARDYDAGVEALGAVIDWANVLVDLAPEEIVESAEGNVAYFEAQRDGTSVADHVEASNDIGRYVGENC